MASDDSFLDAGDILLSDMPFMSKEDVQNPNIIENQFTGIRKTVLRALRRKTVYIPREGKWLRASILATDPLNNTTEDLELLRRARETVFASFKVASPEYTQADWDRVMALDPLFRPDTYVIILEDQRTNEVVGNMKLVYDTPDRPLPAEIRFPGEFQRSAPVQEDVSVFNLVQGKIQKYKRGPVGGAIQVMELFGPGYSAELFFLANFVLAEHRTVRYRHDGVVHETYPKEIIGYGVESEMSAFHAKIGLKQIAKDGDYLMHTMPVSAFQQAYKKSFVFRPRSKKIDRAGMVYQAGAHETYFFVRSIFEPFPNVDAVDNIDVISIKLKQVEKEMELPAQNKEPKSDAVIQRFHEYYRWAVRPHSACIEFYE